MKLVADRLACIRGGRTLFSGLSFAVEGGEALLLLGPNGAGKTTLIRMIVGLLRPGRGPHRPRRRRCRAEPGRAVPLRRPPERREIEPHGGGERRFWCRYPRRTAGDRIDAGAGSLRARGTCATSPPPTCRPGRSGGWALPACSLAERPIWLLDEPTVSLDSAAQDMLARCRQRACRGGRPGGGGDACAARVSPESRELQLGSPARPA